MREGRPCTGAPALPAPVGVGLLVGLQERGCELGQGSGAPPGGPTDLRPEQPGEGVVGSAAAAGDTPGVGGLSLQVDTQCGGLWLVHPGLEWGPAWRGRGLSGCRSCGERGERAAPPVGPGLARALVLMVQSSKRGGLRVPAANSYRPTPLVERSLCWTRPLQPAWAASSRLPLSLGTHVTRLSATSPCLSPSCGLNSIFQLVRLPHPEKRIRGLSARFPGR